MNTNKIIKSNNYNPDVLTCLANLSNDEVFTPPDVANQILDMLPKELFMDPNTKFLDPACKSGVFLREIAKRLLKGLESIIPDLQQRINHIFREQLFGIAVTELTSELSRRSVYCSKTANGRYSITFFDNEQGNIKFSHINHTFKNGNCIYCNASESEYSQTKRGILESHAYEFIHTLQPQDLFKMKFDVIISNPPYQLNTVSNQESNKKNRQAKPIYHYFVETAKKLNPRYITMIIPSRWFAGGMGLDKFRQDMLTDKHITKMVYYANAKDCFPQNSISGGVCYFLREKDSTGPCEYTDITGNNKVTQKRELDEFPVLIKNNQAVNIIRKVIKDSPNILSEIVSPISPFALSTNVKGENHKKNDNDITLYASNGVSYLPHNKIDENNIWIKPYKVMISQLSAEHAGEPGKDGKFKVLSSSMRVLGPNEVCTHSYILIGQFDEKNLAENLLAYLKTKFVRFLLLQSLSSIHISRNSFLFVPNLDYSKNWTDDELFKKYKFTHSEISFIEDLIKPMEDN